MLTEENKKFIRDNRLEMPSRELAKAIGRSKSMVLKFMRDENIQPPAEVISKFRKRAAAKLSGASLEEDQFIKSNYKTMPIKRMAKQLGRSNCFVYGRLKRMGLVVPADVIEKSKKQSQFSPGQEPFIKGKKIREIYSPEAMENVKKSWFKKGNVPGNAFEKDGVITIRKDQAGIKYKWIRISMGNWRHLHIHLWEKANGPVPDDCVVAFKDGNQMNCRLENLELITKAENMARNTIHRYPEELKTSMRLLGRLEKK